MKEIGEIGRGGASRLHFVNGKAISAGAYIARRRQDFNDPGGGDGRLPALTVQVKKYRKNERHQEISGPGRGAARTAETDPLLAESYGGSGD